MMNRHGFEKIGEKNIPELNTRGVLWRHRRTGARLLSMENDDTNKCFGISFRTPPEDSTGLPHILEHSVLCGSRKYPLKDPFVQLLKCSLKTFLNAVTFPDKTCYPVASQNLRDFYRLVNVYLDAVLHPLITPEIFMQEGWHIEKGEDGSWRYRGVVYNEMKGAYSSPDNRICELSQQVLFPDNAYAVDSGGDPAVITQLTYDSFKAFHERYYHPSNSWIYFWGDDDPEERLRMLAAYLDEFEHRDVDSTVRLQSAFKEPRKICDKYAVDPGETNGGHKSLITVNWLLPEVTDTRQRMDFSLLAHLLIGSPAAPLRKALIDSELGESLAGGGLETMLRQMMFSTGLKDIRSEDAEKVEQLIFDTLSEIHREGFDKDLLEAAINSVEFSLREQNTGSFPRGLAVMFGALQNWLYDADPFLAVEYEDQLAVLKDALRRDPRYSERLIGQYLLDNPHRATVLLEPDPDRGERDDAEEHARLQALLGAMDEHGLAELGATAERVRKWQQEPDPPSAIECLPMLRIEDLAPEGEVIPIEQAEECGATLLFHDIFTQGIVYLDVGFDLLGLEPDDLPWVGLLSLLLPDIGAGKDDYIRLSNRIGRDTGGLETELMTMPTGNPAEPAMYMHLRGKCLESNLDKLLSLMRDVLLEPRLDDRDRLLRMALEEKADLESDLIPMGHKIVQGRLLARFSLSGWADDMMDGVAFLNFLRELIPMIRAEWDKVHERLADVCRRLISRSLMHVNVTVDRSTWKRAEPEIRAFMRGIPDRGLARQAWQFDLPTGNEVLLAPSQVNYIGKAMRFYEHGSWINGSAFTVIHYLRTTWMWEQIRVLGGAYGAMVSLGNPSGILSMASYRDPHIDRTLGIYDSTAEYLTRLQIDREELTRAIVGTVGLMDPYLFPDAKGFVSLTRFLCGRTDAERQRIREEIMATKTDDFHDFGERLVDKRGQGLVAVLGQSAAVERSAFLGHLEHNRIRLL